MAHVRKIERIAVSSMRAGKAVPTPKDSEYTVTLDDGTQSVVGREEAVQLAAEEFVEWY